MAYNHLIWMYWVCVFVCVWITSTQELKRHLLSALCNYSHLEAISNVRRVGNSRLPHMYPGAGKLFAFDICPNQWTSIFWIFWVPFTTFISFSFSASSRKCVCVCALSWEMILPHYGPEKKHVRGFILQPAFTEWNMKTGASYACMKFSICESRPLQCAICGCTFRLINIHM